MGFNSAFKGLTHRLVHPVHMITSTEDVALGQKQSRGKAEG